MKMQDEEMEERYTADQRKKQQVEGRGLRG
jgi:hypothetical protein